MPITKPTLDPLFLHSLHPWALIFWTSFTHGRLSTALLSSIYTKQTALFLSKHVVTSLKNTFKLVRQDLPLTKGNLEEDDLPLTKQC